MKIIIVVALVGVLAALAAAGVFMLRKRGPGDGRDTRMARALTLRIALSMALFLFVLLSWAMGWVQPGGLPTGR